jgi:GTP-binding protein
MKAMITIVGRPNVGKSTLFNRLIKKRYAIVADEAGTTRDRIIHNYSCQEIQTMLIDTGGLEFKEQENIEADVQTQSRIAISDSDLILFVIDCSQSLTTDDFAAADILRKSDKRVMLIANKCDNKALEQEVFNLYELGFGDPIQISAIHKRGIDELEHKINDELKKQGFDKKQSEITPFEGTQVCILGKPNAGKSSLVNALTGEEKIIVSDIAGTTRDATDTEIEYEDKKYNLIDTAGLRRRGKIERGIEKFSALRCIQGVSRSDVVVLLIDGFKGITSQDCHIAQYALEEKKGLIIAINKLDLIDRDERIRDQIVGKLRRKFSFTPWAKVVFISAKQKKNTRKILELSEEIMQERRKRVKTGPFNQFMEKITFKHLPAARGAKKPKFRYGSQVATEPPKFLLFFKNADKLHFSYPRYIENEIRKEYGFQGTAIELKIKGKESS